MRFYRSGAGQTTADMNELPGCTTGSSICNLIPSENGGCGDTYECKWFHHKSGWVFLEEKKDSGLVFRFVNFPICEMKNNRHTSPGGITDYLGGKNMIVSTTVMPTHTLEITAHEISHVLGAVDCVASRCVMNPGTTTTTNGQTTLVWCDGCKNEIKAFIRR